MAMFIVFTRMTNPTVMLFKPVTRYKHGLYYPVEHPLKTMSNSLYVLKQYIHWRCLDMYAYRDRLSSHPSKTESTYVNCNT